MDLHDLDLRRALGALGLAAFATGSVAFSAAQSGSPWAPLLVLPWAFVMSGLLAVLLLGPHLEAAEARWLRVAGVALPAVALGFAASEAARTITRVVGRLAAGSAFPSAPALLAEHALLLVMAVPVFWVAWRERESVDARVAMAAVAVGLFALGLAEPTRLLPGLTVVALQLAAVAGLWREREGAYGAEPGFTVEPLDA